MRRRHNACREGLQSPARPRAMIEECSLRMQPALKLRSLRMQVNSIASRASHAMQCTCTRSSDTRVERPRSQRLLLESQWRVGAKLAALTSRLKHDPRKSIAVWVGVGSHVQRENDARVPGSDGFLWRPGSSGGSHSSGPLAFFPSAGTRIIYNMIA